MTVSTLYRTPLALAAALAMAASAYPALAQTSQDSTAATKTQPAASNSAQPSSKSQAAAQPQLSAQDKEAMKLSQEGFNAMRAVRAARIAIFDGNSKAAQDMIAKAETSLKAASKDAKSMQDNGQTKQSASNNANNAEYVPIDGQITLVDAFIDTPAKKSHIDKANQHIAKGDAKSAMDELKLADVGASFTRVLMPLQQTQQHVDAAKKMLDQKKYYEANLALKAAEDGVLIDSVMLTEVPKSDMGSTGGSSSGNSSSSSSGNSSSGNSSGSSGSTSGGKSGS